MGVHSHLFSALVAAFSGNLPETLRANVLAVQGWIGVAFLAFIVFTSNPFTRIFPAPMEGGDLNPILQDIGLAIHPPLLYLGYVGFSVCFSFAVAALLEGRLDAAWARWVRPWALVAWMFLTGGIAMGSYWAYYELGWGGWWFWDPVENASFMPWLVGTALLHSALVMEKRSALKIWTVLLAILTFSLSLLGTFLVRSGVLTSVHSFATDPGRGLFILAILAIFIGGSLSLRISRAEPDGRRHLPPDFARRRARLQQSVSDDRCRNCADRYALPAAAGSDDRRQDFRRRTVLQHDVRSADDPASFAVPFGPLLAWKRGDLYGVSQRLMTAFALSLLAAAIVLWSTSAKSVLAACGTGLAVWLIFGSLTDLVLKSGIGKVSAGKAVARFKGLPRSVFGTALAHIGLGVTLLGIVSVTTFGTENVLIMRPGDTAKVQNYTLRFDGLRPLTGSNFTENRGTFTLLDSSSRSLGQIEPSSAFPSTPDANN